MKRSDATLFAATFAVCIFCVSAVPGSSLPEGVSPFTFLAHFCEYTILGALITLALSLPAKKDPSKGRLAEFNKNLDKTLGNSIAKIVILATVIASVYGMSDELHQLFVAQRSCDPMDWLVDTAGALLGSLIIVLWKQIRTSKHK